MKFLLYLLGLLLVVGFLPPIMIPVYHVGFWLVTR